MLEGQQYRLMVKRAAAEGQTASSQGYLSNPDQLRPGCLLLRPGCLVIKLDVWPRGIAGWPVDRADRFAL